MRNGGAAARADVDLAAVNVKVDPNLKQQTVDESQISATWNFKNVNLGKGFLRATGTYKKWNNLVDKQTGQSGTVTDPIAGVLDYQYWTNDSKAKRSFKDLELDAALNTTDGWQLSANFTWSDLEGNFLGEGKSTPGAGFTTSGLTGAQFASTVGGVQAYDPNALNPSGKLDGGLTINALAAKSVDNAYGKFSFGVKYYYKGAAPYSISRLVNLEANHPLTAGNTNVTSTTSYDQYFSGVASNTALTNFKSRTDISASAQQDFNAFKVKSTQVVAFLKVSVDNLFNHQQQINWNTTVAKATNETDPVSFGKNYGQPTGFQNYVPARSFVLSAGVKF